MHPPRKSSIPNLAFGFLSVLALAGAVYADDTEIFGSQANSAAPNILFVFDTSGSMSSSVKVPVPYDATKSYGGSCNTANIYYSTSGDPTCKSNSFAITNLKCKSALGLLDGSQKKYIDYLIRWSKSGSKFSWTATLNASGTSGKDVECFTDDGQDGDTPDVTKPRPITGTTTSSSGGWTNTANSDYWTPSPGAPGAKVSYTLMSGNYLNFLANPPSTVIGSRLSVVQEAAKDLLDGLNNVNVGLMRYSDNSGGGSDSAAAGGMVMYPVSPLDTNRTAIKSALDSYKPDGWTPLSETLYEAYLYLSGKSIQYGDTSKVCINPQISSPGNAFCATPLSPLPPTPLYRSEPSVAASRTGNSLSSTQYKSPIQYSCQKNFIVYLTDGLPTQDNQADSMITGLGGSCDNTSQPPYGTGWGPGSTAGSCLGGLAEYMYKGDLLPDNQAKPETVDQQNVQTYFIAFGDDPNLASAYSYLQTAAARGGGKAYTALGSNDLSNVLSSIVSEILDTSTTFTAPTVAVNAFNRTQTLNDLYVSVFQPTGNAHWPGNLKKYKFANGQIQDANDQDAVNANNGFFKDSAQERWSTAPDGTNVIRGGAANHIPDPASRTIYTFIGANPGKSVDMTSSTSYGFATSNAALTTAILGIGNPGDPTRDDLIDWARGENVKGETIDGTVPATRHVMGDPLHGQPAIVVYGGSASSPDVSDAVVFVPTNDGYLHAFRATDGMELWAFIPQELLGDLATLYENGPASAKHYSLDGDIRVLKYDVNGDGIVESGDGDQVLIFFGQRRGGNHYFALDVTNKTAPKFMWTSETAQLPGIGESWSTPAIARVVVQGETQNTQHFVLIFGGGYDANEDSAGYVSSDGVGNQVFMVDAYSGARLWYASQAGSKLNLTRMDHAIPSPVSVLDIDGDGFADRMYVGDMAGQLWRFDIYSGNPVDQLVTGGVIASLGTHDDTVHLAADNRRFYESPDIAAIQKKGVAPYFNIAIGSGYRGHPLDTTAHDTFYAIRDYAPFTKFKQTQYGTLTVIHDTDTNLVDITTNVAPTMPVGAAGWKMRLNQPGSSWIGEKVLSSASTLNNQVLFTTYTPNVSNATVKDPCQVASAGKTRVYAVSVFDGAPVQNLNLLDDSASGTTAKNTTVQDRYVEYNDIGIPSQLQFLFPGNSNGNNGNQGPACIEGVRVLGVCTNLNTRVKTYWRDSGAN